MKNLSDAAGQFHNHRAWGLFTRDMASDLVATVMKLIEWAVEGPLDEVYWQTGGDVHATTRNYNR